jgi:hypothetical protein
VNELTLTGERSTRLRIVGMTANVRLRMSRRAGELDGRLPSKPVTLATFLAHNESQTSIISEVLSNRTDGRAIGEIS